jgi:hypothetical protein
MPLAARGPREVSVLKTLGAAVGAVLVILFLVTVASRLTSHSEPETQESSLHR